MTPDFRDHGEEIRAALAERDAEPKRKVCFRCGRIRCETCGGMACVTHYPESMRTEVVPCPDCADGWRDAELGLGPVESERGLAYPVKGTDPAILCPECKEAE